VARHTQPRQLRIGRLGDGDGDKTQDEVVKDTTLDTSSNLHRFKVPWKFTVFLFSSDKNPAFDPNQKMSTKQWTEKQTKEVMKKVIRRAEVSRVCAQLFFLAWETHGRAAMPA
jgi:hypothetical protein